MPSAKFSFNRRQFLRGFALSVSGIFVPRIVKAQFTHTDIPWLASGAATGCSDGGLTTNWVNNILANGGSAPSANTQAAAKCFGADLIAAGIDNKFFTLNFFAPDNPASANSVAVPFIVGTGFSAYTFGSSWNSSFLTTAGLLSGNGFGVGSINTGVVVNTNFTTASMGIHAYGMTPSALPNYSLGGGDGSKCAEVFCNGSSLPFYVGSYSAWTIGPASGIISNGEYGFISANRTAASGAGAVTEYVANGNHAWQSIGTASTSDTLPTGANTLGYQLAGVCAGISGQCRLSFMAFSSGLTSGQGQSLFNAVQKLRTALGGGFT